jgi:threonine dehydrogenase-like Zn-dependent dehydrogenase
MKSLYFDGDKIIEKELPTPSLHKGEALISVKTVGICSTDLEITKGYMNFRGVPGHEFTGVVKEALSRDLIGRRVVGEINVPCNQCQICRNGLAKHCPNRRVLGISEMDGVLAEKTVLPEENLHQIPDELSDSEAVFTEPLAAACEITSRFDIGKYRNIAVLGDGKLASLVAQVLKLNNEKVTILGKHQNKMELLGKLGLETLDISQRGLIGRIFDLIVECTGSSGGLPIAAGLIKPRGLIILKSTYHGKVKWNPSGVVVDEITITGSRCGPFDTALRLLSEGKVKVGPLVSGVFTFQQWREAFGLARDRESFKVLIKIP